MVFTACMRAEHSGHTCNMEQNQAGPSEELTCADATPVCPPECILLGQVDASLPAPKASLSSAHVMQVLLQNLSRYVVCCLFCC